MRYPTDEHRSARPARLVAAVALSAVALTGLAACSGGAATTSPATQPARPSAATPPTPTDLTATPVSADAVQLEWTPVEAPEDLLRYEVRVDGGEPLHVDNEAETYTFAGVQGGVPHHVELLAVAKAGPSGSAHVDVTLPTP